YFAAKHTSSAIHDCHPLSVEYTDVRYERSETSIRIKLMVKTVYKTGVEVEAMHGAAVVARTMYVMLKFIDKNDEIKNIRLVEKKGGRSDFMSRLDHLSASVIVCSDSISAGGNTDRAGLAIQEKLKTYGVSINDYLIIPDDLEEI